MIDTKDSSLHCKRCQHFEIKKNGIVYGKQRYQCKKCKYIFAPTDGRLKKTEKTKQRIARLCAYGVPAGGAAEVFGVSPTAVKKWAKQYPALPFALLRPDFSKG